MWTQVTHAGRWNEALQQLPSPHVLQSWAWGEFKSRWGWSAERWLLTDAATQPRAAVQVLKRTINRLPVSVLYVPKGPVCADLAAHDEALTLLEALARKGRAVWVKVDGDPPRHCDATGDASAHIRHSLVARGWRYSPSQVQFRNTMHTDVRQSDDALLAAMKPKCRYNIRLAEKRGVRVRIAAPIGDADVQVLYAMYAETARRDGFIIRDLAYYADAWHAMDAVGFIAEREGEPLGGIVLLCFADRAWYFYGMSRSAGREHMPNHLLQWSALRWARDHGYAIYDWWGAPESLDESDPLWGVYRFKEGFGARFVEGIGAWDYSPSPLLYRAYVTLGSTLIRSGLAG